MHLYMDLYIYIHQYLYMHLYMDLLLYIYLHINLKLFPYVYLYLHKHLYIVNAHAAVQYLCKYISVYKCIISVHIYH